MPPSQPQSTARRADAERNRDRILAAARSAFAASDTPVSMAAISRRAGVGMATLYRNFSSRRELLEALFTDEQVNAYCDAAETLDARRPARPDGLATPVLCVFTNKRQSPPSCSSTTDDSNPVFSDSRAERAAGGRPLLSPRSAPTRSATTSRSSKSCRHDRHHRHDPRRHPLPRANPPDRA